MGPESDFLRCLALHIGGSQCDHRYLALSKVVTATGFIGAAIRLVLDQVVS